MKKVVYLIRHSEPMKKRNNVINSDSLQIWNEKNPLSIDGEKKAELMSNNNELSNIDYLVSSKYVRAISTAKYIAFKNNIDLNINENFGERKHGVNSWDELPAGFEKRQMIEADFKVGDGESQREVASRMYDSLIEVLNNNYSRVAIVSHATAILFLLMKFGSFDGKNLLFNGKVIMDNLFKWSAPDCFKLTFNDKELIDIIHIEL